MFVSPANLAGLEGGPLETRSYALQPDSDGSYSLSLTIRF